MGARVGIVVFVVDLNFRGTAAARWCEVGRAVGAASSLPGQNTCRAMQDGRCESGSQKQRGFFGQTCATGCGSNPFAGYGLPQLEQKFQSSNGCGGRHLGQEFGRTIVSFSPIFLLPPSPSPSLSVFLITSIIYLSTNPSIHPSLSTTCVYLARCST